MTYRLIFRENRNLPQLMWVAKIDKVNPKEVQIIHGNSVEIDKTYLVEGVWDGPFEKGEFHKTSNFFGSGIRVDKDKVHFVTSKSVTDRLLLADEDDTIYVSNSLIGILAVTDSSMDPEHDYNNEGLPLINGIDQYDGDFKIVHPKIKKLKQIFLKNIIYEDNRITYNEVKHSIKIECYNDYIDHLNTILFKLKENWESNSRKKTIEAISTISQGYDATAVTALVRNYGVNICFTGHYIDRPSFFNKVQKRIKDDGTPAAKDLGIKVKYLNKNRNSISNDELFFLAINYPKNSTYSCFETSLHSMNEFIDKDKCLFIVFTGYNGDHLWDLNPIHISDQIIRKSNTGLGLTEVRLKSGFFNVALPYILAREQPKIVNISRSREMDPWKLNNNYDRPIPRRIAESAGIKREHFGMQKTFIADRYFLPINPQLRIEFLKHISDNTKISPFFIQLFPNLFQALFWIGNKLKKFNLDIRPERFLMEKTGIDTCFLMNHWAIGVLTEKIKKNIQF